MHRFFRLGWPLPVQLVAAAGVSVCWGLVLLAPAVASANLGPPDLTAMVDMQTNYGWGAAFGWPEGTNPCVTIGANWNGVGCDASASRVQDISVSCGASPLGSDFPSADIAQLTAMRQLRIGSCYLSPQAAANFSGVDSLTQLNQLSLSGDTGITGTIDDMFPSGLSPTTHPNLVQLDLSRTHVGGTIPSGVVQYNDGHAFRLNDAAFTGTLSPTGSTPAVLQVQGNALRGVVPDYIVNDPFPQFTYAINLDYNMFDVAGTPAGNIDTLDPTWRQTQTVPPTAVQVTGTGIGSATISWTPITYQGDGGYYEVLSSQTQGGPYTLAGTTAGSGGKSATGLTVSGLTAGTDYFVVRAFTPAHVSQPFNAARDNPNDLTSVDSAEVSASVQATASLNTALHDGSGSAWSAADVTGAQAVDTASVGGSGAVTPTGTVTYDYYASLGCSGAAIASDTVSISAGSVPDSAGTARLAAGAYGVRATYSGDSAYIAPTPVCVAFTVGQATPTLGTAVLDGSGNPWSAREVTGAQAMDSSTVTGVAGFTPSGSVTYLLFANGTCTAPSLTSDTESLSGGVVPNSTLSPALSAGSYSYLASYSGDGSYSGVAGPCEPFVVASVQSGPPSATISWPPDHQTYAVDQVVRTAFSCRPAPGGASIRSCRDSNGATGRSGVLDTSRPGHFAYSVTATAIDGQSARASIEYTVAGRPKITIVFPADGARYAYGAAVTASFTCTEGPDGPGLRSCTGTVSNGHAVDTHRIGEHEFSVTAVSADGQRSTESIRYRVLAPTHICRVFRIRTQPDGIVSFRIRLPRAGSVDVFETSWTSVFARLHLHIAGARTLLVRVAPSAAGRRLVRRERGGARIRLRVTFTPAGRSHGGRGFDRLKIML